MRWLKRTAWVLLALLVLGAVAAGVYVQRALPLTEGVIALHGARAPIRIVRDADGIPLILAASTRDAVFALGVVHAQDRLWQLETHRRIAAGRLAEAFGPGAVDSDRFLRALGVRRAAERQWQRLPPASRDLLQAYADGINAVIADGMRARPPEFVLLGIRPEPWQPVDSLGWAIMMAWDLGANWSSELLRLRLSLFMPVDRIAQLLPVDPRDAPPVTADYAALFRGLQLDARGGTKTADAWQALHAMAPPSGIEGVGSNNWVLSGRRSTTGSPLLANDPHLKLGAPSLWYLARMHVPEQFAVAGATLPGLPGVVLGQNGRIAWGYTNTGPDVQDLYIEQVDPADPARYRTPGGGSAAFETATEVIHVKGGADVTMTVRRTRHGPVISDAGAMADVTGAAPGGGAPAYVLAMRWTALDDDVDPIAPAFAMQSAGSVAAFIDAATRGWVAPMQNMVVADREGHIGFVAPGRVPLRKPDNDLHGLVPSPGWDARYDWDGFIPADRTPREVDPDRGFIATANQRIAPPGYPWFLTGEWALPHRQRRIEQLLLAREKHGMADLAAMQADVKSLAVTPLLPWLLNAKSGHPLASAALAAMQGFDGTMAADSAAPLIWWAWQRQLARAVFADEMPAALWQQSFASRTMQDALEGVAASHDAAGWCDDRTTPAVETCADIAGLALTRALDELQALQGGDVARWRWGRAHAMRAEHRPFSRVRWLAPWFELRAPVGGDTHTVNVARVGLKPDATTGELYLDEHGPSLRAIYDVADPRQSRVMQSSGQSGIVFSPLYRRFVEPWAQVRYVPLWAPAAGEPLHGLTIEPAR